MSQLETPSEFVSSYPFAPVEGNLFTPVCLRTHWDPTEMLRHIIPQQHVELPQDFRPWTKICKNYVTSAAAVVVVPIFCADRVIHRVKNGISGAVF